PRVEDVEFRVCDGGTDGYDSLRGRIGCDFVDPAPDDCLCRAVLVDEPDVRRVTAPEAQALGLQRLAADYKGVHRRDRFICCGQLAQIFEVRRGNLDEAENALASQQMAERFEGVAFGHKLYSPAG